DLVGPALERKVVGAAALRGEEREARGVVVEDRAGQLLDPLVGRAADPAPFTVSRRGERAIGDAAGKVEDGADRRGVAAGRGGGLVDERARRKKTRTQPIG